MSVSGAESVAPTMRSGGPLGFLKRNPQLLLGLAISGWSVWQLGQAVDPREVGAQLAGANWGLLALSFGSISLAMVLKCIRQQYLFGQRVAPPIPPLLSALYIGYLMNTVLPARVGELVRAFLVGRHAQVGTPAALSSVVLEKLLDLGAMALLLLALVASTPLPAESEWVTPIAYTCAVALAGGVVGFGLVLVARSRLLAVVAFCEVRLAPLQRLRLGELATSFLDALAGLGRRASLPRLIFWSIVVWVCAGLSMWAGLTGAGVSVGLSALLLTLVVTNIGMAVPSAPGYVGVFHGLFVLSLQPFGVDPSHALGAAIIMHAVVFGNFIVGGLWYLWRGGYSFGRLRDASAH